jgi:hypothetical protein
MPLLSLLALALFCWLSCTTRAAEPSPTPSRIWSGLVLATNNAHPAQPPERLRTVAGKLKNIFGYNQFEIIGEYSEKMDDPNESWLIPSKDFYLSVKGHTVPGQNYPMKIVLFQNRRRLAELEAHVSAESPLFIRGPLYAHGQLVIVLRVADPSEFPAREMKPAILGANPAPVLLPSPPKEKEHPVVPPPPPPAVVEAPKEKPNPMPADRVGPLPDDHFGPLPADRPGLDSKLNKP